MGTWISESPDIDARVGRLWYQGRPKNPKRGVGMRKLVGFALLAIAILAPSVAHARGGRGGVVMTPFGPINMNSPAYQMSGGNPLAAVEIQQEMNMMKAQQQYMQQYMKAQQQFQQKMKSDPNFRKQVEAQQAAMMKAYQDEMAPKKKKKRPTFNGSGATKSAIKSRHDDTPSTDSKSATSTASSDLKNRRDDTEPTKASK